MSTSTRKQPVRYTHPVLEDAAPHAPATWYPRKPRPSFISLFAGIGGIDLGLERSGWSCIAQVEIDPFCRRVLAKHWPHVPRFEDVRTFNRDSIDERPVLIAGGFPCQDISAANYRAEGIDGARSGLWSEYLRIIREVRPDFVLAENVPALTFRGLDRVLWDLAQSGFDAEWQSFSAQMLGAPHERERIFVVAYPASQRREADEIFDRSPSQAASEKQASRLRSWPGECQRSSALPNRVRWCPDSEVCRVADGIPDRLDRYRGVGNAVSPVVAEWIGRRLMQAYQQGGVL